VFLIDGEQFRLLRSPKIMKEHSYRQGTFLLKPTNDKLWTRSCVIEGGGSPDFWRSISISSSSMLLATLVSKPSKSNCILVSQYGHQFAVSGNTAWTFSLRFRQSMEEEVPAGPSREFSLRFRRQSIEEEVPAGPSRESSFPTTEHGGGSACRPIEGGKF
ncbi:hypothetical protein BHE74_00059031, partial [Ensete ventricosum]